MNSEVLVNYFTYDDDTGLLRWKRNKGNYIAGDEAGTVMKSGHIRVGVNGDYKLAHRVAWLLYYGAPPTGVVDHIDGDPSNNKITNLRDITQRENSRNQKHHRDGATSGISNSSGKWRAYTTIKKKQIFLGYHPTKEAALEARIIGEKRLGIA